MNNNDAIIALAAATMIHDDSDLGEWADMDETTQHLLIRDYRDEFASSPFPLLANAKLNDALINDIQSFLNAAICRA
jgi:hypothetical protein